ncbi:transposase [Cryobacterium sp. Y11]|uniref:transposase n=1 Tax=Cryobacterium sp. Y11 TaxID=2045016 RepID=UPI00351161C9
MAQCTTAQTGRNLVIHPHDRLRREHRVRAQDAEFQRVYKQHRPMVERSSAWMTRGACRVL